MTVEAEKAQHASYEGECKKGLGEANAMLASLEALKGPQTIASALEPLNKLNTLLDKHMNRAGLYRSVHPSSMIREAAEKCEQEFSKVATLIGMSRPIYDALQSMPTKDADTITTRYIQHTLRDFRRAGVDKDEATRAKIKALREELVQIGQEFSNNIRNDVRTITLDSPDKLAGLPEDYRAEHKPGKDNKIVLTTDYPDYLPFLQYADDDAARLEFYRAFRQRGNPKNIDVLANLIKKRNELAQLLGYKTWAAYVTEDKMIGSPEAVDAFITKISDMAKPRATKDYEALLGFLKSIDPKATEVGDWQRSYLENKYIQEKYKFDPREVRQYFRYGQVKKGVLDTTAKMFGVTFRPLKTEVWHPSVEAYEILDASGTVFGRFFLDMHPRDGKYKHAAAFPIQSGVKGTQLPEAALVCNFSGDKDPDALMEHDQVETFFHEFGHLLHFLFGGQQQWVSQSGFNTEWDFVEVPSQMLEEWGWELSVLKRFASNKKGETIPDALVEKMRSSRDFGKGLQVRQQMVYASISLGYYNQDPAKLDPLAWLKAMQLKHGMFKYVDGTQFQLSFGHLDGYSAIYYTYMWSLVIAKDLFSEFKKNGLLDPATSNRYRQAVLAPGGSKDAKVLVKDFLGREYNFNAFTNWLGS